ncbi:MAG: hypothetical protein H6Q02_2309 [Acidobacteria bacterium]|nr:hypothetical protein [Acidobacteriota bacterium]
MTATLLLFLRLVALVVLLVRVLLVVVLLLALVLLVLALDVVARRERRSDVAAQRDRGDVGRVGVDPGVVEVRVAGRERAVGQAVEVLPLRVEHRRHRRVELARRLVQRARPGVVEEDLAVLLVDRAGVRQPPAVRRPARAEPLETALVEVDRLVDRLDRTGRDVGDVDVHRLVGEGDPGAVGRPEDVVAEARAHLRYRALLARSVGGSDRQLVLAGAVGEVRELLAVGRDRRVALGGARGPRQVEHRAVLGGQREQLAARLDDNPLRRRRQRRVGDELGDVLHLRLEGGAVGDDLDLDFDELLARQLEPPQPAGRLENDVGGPDRREADIVLDELRDLARGAAREVHRPDVVALRFVAVGQEVHRLAIEHRVRVVGEVAGHVPGLKRCQVEQPDLRRPAAAVALPGAEVAGDRHVREPGAVRRERAELAVRHRQPLRQAAGARDFPELVEAVLAARHPGGEQDRLAVRVPLEHPVGRRVMGQPGRQTAGRRHDVEIGVAVVVPREREQSAVGGEARERLLACRCRQALRRAALLRHQPDVAGVDEGDLARRDVGVAQQPGVDLRRGGRRRQHRCQGQDQGLQPHRSAPFDGRAPSRSRPRSQLKTDDLRTAARPSRPCRPRPRG